MIVLTLNTHVSVAVHDNYLLLKIRGAKDNFPKIIEQVCWVASVAGGTSISLLKKFAKETNNGATTRGYAETVHTGKPVLTAGANGQFKVSFSPPRTEKDPNHGFVAKSGHCWKTMAGLSIVASGYTVPPRPEEGSGLEAPLVVLHELFRRGCARKRILPLDKPMVMIPTKVGTHADDEAYQLRMIMAVGAQQRTQGNAIYWHFDPAKLCNSMESCEQLEKEIRASPSVINSRARHFVGWSSKAGFLAGKQPNNSWGGRLDWPPPSHMERPSAAPHTAPKLEAGSLISPRTRSIYLTLSCLHLTHHISILLIAHPAASHPST